ncbi:YcdB/YcdC domain-containing protein [Feifania hominis]|uniref:S-layer homology domain-containing protein n=1 Tax=Feifania hominis TaxID=2763660 RepID=A0A926DDZ5_9FIRM|nr:YcdB/YcdC domain-containing protein [Feifania hominis]MBC8536092.1 S-layer homology domain-containing protein [Feifania hominis]
MKKYLAILLSVVLLCGAALPAGAAQEDVKTRLAAVTSAVKNTLGIGDEYDEFYGELEEGTLSPCWRLQWSAQGRSLTVQALESGKVLTYRYSDDFAESGGRGFAPSFPKMSREEAHAAAMTFLGTVLEKPIESVSLEENDTVGSLGTTRYYFSGTVLLNGLPSPLSVSISVRAADGKIVHFRRDDVSEQHIGGIPSAVPAASAQHAGELLKQKLSLRLEYVLSDEGNRAVLRYLPERGDEYLVDAATGELVNVSERYEDAIKSSPGAGGATNESTADLGLSESELDGIEKLDGVLTKQQLDAKARGIDALGLSGYTLANVSYSVDRETADVSARLQYAKKTDNGIWRRNVTQNARTGALLAVSSSAPYEENAARPVSFSAAQTTAEAFLREQCGEAFAKSALYASSDARDDKYTMFHSLTYAHRHEGYFLPANSITVGVDASDGSISTYYSDFDLEVTFDSAEGIVSQDEALAAYFATFAVELGYRSLPEKIDLSAPDYRPLAETGYGYLYRLKLAYTLESDRTVRGIDAKTGEAIFYESVSRAITYDDLGAAYPQIETLAKYGVGYLGGSFRPNEALTQRDLLALLTSTQGHLFDPAGGEQELESLYEVAYNMGLLTRAERDPNRLMTRAETVRLLLDSAGYGEVAKLPGIFRCSFRDAANIPEDVLGYAAIAQGLGVVHGDGAGNFAPARTATRAEAAFMLYNYLSR